MNTHQAQRFWAAAKITAVAAVASVAVSACGGSGEGTNDGEPTTTSPFVTPTETTSRVAGTPPSTPVAAPSTLPAEVAGVNRESADDVAEAVARIWYSWDTTVDLGPYDARVRAVPLLDDNLSNSIRSYPPIAGPGADWLDLTSKNARLTVGADDVRLASETGAPADTATSAARLLTVTQRVSTPQGPLADRSIVVAVVLVHGADGWRVSKVVPR
ncbi:hypothetical protein GS966_27780 [Rhodococcus hoagii]|nr:hypothetical protein [Prescottella equi]NKS10212.1 hypothetical protein [Prescottella equi]NKS35203.1 hypothetical protein [Prescottella equi]NKS35263.1 hypothetical protein [Prescottella equi]NKS62109.1 hypothetical protein [Prescottella equi]